MKHSGPWHTARVEEKTCIQVWLKTFRWNSSQPHNGEPEKEQWEQNPYRRVWGTWKELKLENGKPGNTWEETLPGNGRFSNQWSGCGKELPEQGGIRKNRPKWDGQTRRVTAKPSRRKNPYLPQGKKKLNPKKGEKEDERPVNQTEAPGRAKPALSQTTLLPEFLPQEGREWQAWRTTTKKIPPGEKEGGETRP